MKWVDGNARDHSAQEHGLLLVSNKISSMPTSRLVKKSLSSLIVFFSLKFIVLNLGPSPLQNSRKMELCQFRQHKLLHH